MTPPTALVILDGFGISSQKKYNAIAHAHTPHLNHWLLTYPHAQLKASGTSVGLPRGFQGNSEVGHITIGAGRIIDQPITLWRNAIKDGSFFHNPTLTTSLKKLVTTAGTLHLMGLLSDAGIHAHTQDMYALIDAAHHAGIKKIVLHLFLDGRDMPPRSAYTYLKEVENYVKKIPHALIGSVHGRLYAMDRNNNWQRTEKTYRILTEQCTESAQSWEKVLEKNYAHLCTDEFVQPTQLDPNAFIKNGDGIILWNIRPDRARQLAASFTQDNFSAFITKPLNLAFFITPVDYGKTIKAYHLFTKKPAHNTLKDILALCGKTIFSVAETEKYAHVTYFFRGENEEKVATEERVIVPSVSTVETYKDNPKMSAHGITDAVIQSLKNNPKDFYLINYANADMVGHSGDFNATVQAVEYLDTQLKRLYDIIVTQMNGTLYVTSDHGKAETMYDSVNHQPYTAHTCNRVPFLMLNKKYENIPTALPLTQLADIAPFILTTMGLPVPPEMIKKAHY